MTDREVRHCGNLLLNKLSKADLAPLLPHLEKVQLKAKDVIYECNRPMLYVHFPCNSAMSNLILMKDGVAVEVGSVGNEGFTGVELLGRASVALETCICQLPGDSLRMRTVDFREMISSPTPVRHLAEGYLQAYLAQVSQLVACNRLHTVEEQFARWLLLTHDRMREDDVYLTQEFIASMLGVHRPTVSTIAATFQQAGIIQYNRGKLKILNREALEDTACECYAAVGEQFKRVLGSTRS
jgi:hypothetical protein